LLELPDYYAWCDETRSNKETQLAVLNVKTGILKHFTKLPRHITNNHTKISMVYGKTIPLAEKVGANTVLKINVIKQKDLHIRY
jgi:hypothetical protein|tara:strand:- start:2152 stop:2403 length:252 start_codon:yes stop_codon:yes gene_type:complete